MKIKKLKPKILWKGKIIAFLLGLIVFVGISSVLASWPDAPSGVSSPAGWLGELFNINESGTGKLIIKSEKVGIGTDSPITTLDVAGNIHSSGQICDSTGCIGAGGGGGDSYSLDAADGNPTDVVYVNNDGKIKLTGEIQLANLNPTTRDICDVNTLGSIYYDTVDNKYYFCLYNGSYKWESYIGCDYANSWTPNQNTVCVGKSFTQINNCTSESRTVFGTKLGCPSPSSKKVFVTSEAYNGSLGGVEGADSKCQTLATAASLPGTYLAWIATSDTNDPESRFIRNDGPYELVNGTLIAESWTDLTDGFLMNIININEKNLSNSKYFTVFTNVKSDGSCRNSGSNYSNCLAFSSAYSSYWMGDCQGNCFYGGGTIYVNNLWSAGTYFQGCDNKSRLFCFEQ